MKQIKTLEPLDMEPHKTIPKKTFALEEENICAEEINLTPQNRMVTSIGANVDVSITNGDIY